MFNYIISTSLKGDIIITMGFIWIQIINHSNSFIDVSIFAQYYWKITVFWDKRILLDQNIIKEVGLFTKTRWSLLSIKNEWRTGYFLQFVEVCLMDQYVSTEVWISFGLWTNFKYTNFLTVFGFHYILYF